MQKEIIRNQEINFCICDWQGKIYIKHYYSKKKRAVLVKNILRLSLVFAILYTRQFIEYHFLKFKAMLLENKTNLTLPSFYFSHSQGTYFDLYSNLF